MIQHKNIIKYLIVTVFVALCISLLIHQDKIPEDVIINIPQKISEVLSNTSNMGEEKHVTVTCFSSVECHSNWCNAHRGEPRGQQAAIATGLGSYSQIYIPAYDKYYHVIQGAPATGTDVDIWFGDDHDGARQCGDPTLLVYFIK